MAGWSHDKRVKIEKAFYQYLDRCFINSKDAGQICLGKVLYEGQRRVITQIFDALENDIHKVFILKSRQLGISTIIRALTVFLLGVHKGLKGAIVFDTDNNKNTARTELETIINDLPSSLKFPGIKNNNRTGLRLANDSEILFMSAGVRKSKTGGTLGRSVGLTIAHLSELCSFDNDEGLEAFEQSLSEVHPDRLYIYESTARGFNQWHTMWKAARSDPHHCVCIFLGWWSKDSQVIPRASADFALYGTAETSPDELDKIKLVKDLYDHQITDEQLAWVRRKYDPTSTIDNPDANNDDADPLRVQEQPWTEDEAFQQTGSVFFPAKQLTEQTLSFQNDKYQRWMFMPGGEFTDMRIHEAPSLKMTDLKVWEEPDPDGSYIIACDPAFGENPDNDRSAIQVGRCYSDGIDQVAEYASPLVNTRQLAWVIASLLGWYGFGNAQVRYVLELNGPGTAVFNALKELRFQLDQGYFGPVADEKGLKDVFKNVRTYIYTRPDGMTSGQNYHFKCLALGTPLPTPTGWTTMGSVQVGDKLIDDQGQPCNVLGVSEVYDDRECYHLSFDDGADFVADAGHLWEVRGHQAKYDKAARIVKTADLVPGKDEICTTQPLQLPAANLPIDPYVLGVWLGDGSSSGGLVFSHADDAVELGKYLSESGLRISFPRKGKTCSRQMLYGLHPVLRSANLLKNKHIPAIYLRASFTQRLALLQGLMDTDGTINAANGRQCAFVTTNMALSAGFSELLRSLGIKSKCTLKNPTLFYKGKQVECALAHQFWFTGYADVPVFRLRRKREKLEWKGKQQPRFRKSKRHHLVSIKKVPSKPVRCVWVDSPSSLYLAGRSMIPTHNTNPQLKVLIMERLRDFISNGAFRIKSSALIEELKTIARDGDSISAPQSMRDDLTLAAAFMTNYWETSVRKELISQRKTRASEEARKRLSIIDQVKLFNQSQLGYFFQQKSAGRAQAARAQFRQRYRHGR